MQLSPDASSILAALVKQVVGVREERKVWALTLTALASHFDAAAGAVFIYRRSKDDLDKTKSIGGRETWPDEKLVAFFHNRRPELDADIIMAPVRRGNHVIGVLVLKSPKAFPRGAGKEMTEILRVVGGVVGHRSDLALTEAECAIGRAVLASVAPKDVAYRVLHRLRQFIAYDHGATLVGLTAEGRGRVLARQVAWTKGRSDLVGRTVQVGLKDAALGMTCSVLVPGASPLWDTLEPLRETGSPPKASILAGPLRDQGRLLGLVEVAGRRPGFFLERDIEILSRFLPYLAWSIKSINDVPEAKGGSHD
jgi:hypothetical protein